MPEEKVTHDKTCFYDPLTGRGNPCSCGAAADAGPRPCAHEAKLGARCLDCGARYYNDEWHSPSKAPVPQEAAPMVVNVAAGTPDLEGLNEALIAENKRRATAPDWAMRVAREEFGYVAPFDQVAADVIRKLREAGSERERELVAALRAGIAALYSANPASHEWIDAKRKFISETSRLLGGELK